MCVFFFQAEDGIRDLVRSRGLGDVYKRQVQFDAPDGKPVSLLFVLLVPEQATEQHLQILSELCLLYTSDAADERSSVDLGGRRIIKKKRYHDLVDTHRFSIQYTFDRAR